MKVLSGKVKKWKRKGFFSFLSIFPLFHCFSRFNIKKCKLLLGKNEGCLLFIVLFWFDESEGFINQPLSRNFACFVVSKKNGNSYFVSFVFFVVSGAFCSSSGFSLFSTMSSSNFKLNSIASSFDIVG